MIHLFKSNLNDLVHLFEEFHSCRLDLTRLNFGVITLIRKKKGVDMIHMFIPIFLLNVFFKIFYKALSTHFDPAIDKIVLSCQTVSIKGRNIMVG
jgi:hypothetical protein